MHHAERAHLLEEALHHLTEAADLIRHASAPAQHRYAHDTDRCACGGAWVFFEPEMTYGCEVAGPPAGVILGSFGEERCALCGEPFGEDPFNYERGEFADLDAPEASTVVAHVECALARGLDVA